MEQRLSLASVSWMEARDVARYPTMHKIVPSLPTTRNYLVQNGNNVEVETPYFRIIMLLLHLKIQLNFVAHNYCCIL